MKLLSASVKTSHPLLSKGYSVEFTAAVSHTRPEFSAFVHGLQNLINAMAPSETTVENIKGKNDELFMFAGEIPLDEEDMHAQEGVHFEYSITTEFKQLKDPKTFLHSVHENLIGDLPEDISPKDLSWLAPVFPREARMGIELFAPHFFSSSLGLAPVIRQSIAVEAQEETSSITIISEKLKTADAPLSNELAWEGLCGVYARAYQLSLKEVYDSKR